MISVEEATARIVASLKPLATERVVISHAAGRVLAEDARAKLSQPPYAVSSMDGYAVRAADIVTAGRELAVIGSAPAGHPFAGKVGAGQAVRIFTGGVIPKGADTIVIQEDTTATRTNVTLNVAVVAGRHIRTAGLDFAAGDVLAAKGRMLSSRDVSLLAAADLPDVQLQRKPIIAFAATGDELSLPGAPRKPGGIVASSGYGLAAMIESWGGTAVDLGIVPDTADAVAGIAEKAKGADLIVTLGGASVGDHDLVQKALGPKGFALDFWKIAMRPGKPLIFGHLGTTPLLGLPGNPVSTLVCALLFLKPAIAAMLGANVEAAHLTARLAADLKANDGRQDYVRARLSTIDGERVVEAFAIQDSSMLSVLARADVLIVRAPNAPLAKARARVDILLLE